MNRIVLGLICGVVFGVLSILPMLRMTFVDRRAALLGSFLNRFAIGFLIPNSFIPLDPVVVGGLLGMLLSLPDALITKSYAPIMVSGVVGGLLIGLATRFAVGA